MPPPPPPPPPPPEPPSEAPPPGEDELTVIVVLVDEPRLFVSPEYIAVRVGLPAIVSEYETAHEPDDKVHEVGVNAPPEDDDEKLTVPVGLYPVTVAVHVVLWDTDTELGEHDTDVVDDALFTVIVVDPEEPRLLASPEYVAVIVRLPTAVAVAVVEHERDDRVHEVGLNERPEPLHDTLPVGLEPVTVAVHAVDEPTAIVVGLHDTDVVVDVFAKAIIIVCVLPADHEAG
jgi:hypothetical protein